MTSKAQLLLDIVQIGLDMIGIVDPTGLADAASGVISLSKGKWLDAVISGASIIPYIGDLAKVGKLQGYVKTVREAVQFAVKDAKFAAQLKDELREISKLIDRVPFDKLPTSITEPLQQLKKEIDEFLVGLGNLMERQLKDPATRRFNAEYHAEGALTLGKRKTPMDLSNAEAEKLLKEAIPGSGNSQSLWGYKDGKAYRFFFDNQTAWHGYPLKGERPPSDVLKKWRDAKKITNVDYNKFLGIKQRAR